VESSFRKFSENANSVISNAKTLTLPAFNVKNACDAKKKEPILFNRAQGYLETMLHLAIVTSKKATQVSDFNFHLEAQYGLKKVDRASKRSKKN